MKTRLPVLKMLCSLLLILLLCVMPLLTVPPAATNAQVKALDLRRAPYLFSVDEVTGGKGFGSSTIYVYEDFVFPENGTLTLKGWLATDEGVSHYEYAWVSDLHSVPSWIKASQITIVKRPDLINAGIPYPGGHDTAGFSIDILPPAGAQDGYYDLYVRAVAGDGVGCDIILFSHMMYGTPDHDDGEKRIISFPRLEKTHGALTDALVNETGLVMTNRSVVALGDMDLSVFGKVTVTYSISQSYEADRKALLGFKSSEEHLYGDGEGLYNLTHHITALPLNTSTTETQTVEIDFSEEDFVPHKGLYLSAYVKDGVTLTIHHMTLTYRGQEYDRTAAKIYFSSDIINRFTGRNLVDLKGVQDAVMGEVLRIEVIDQTNDPFTHFNASGLLKDHEIRLSADDYKYMVVLARANQANNHSSMTFYLCAGNIVGATETCTYTHQLIKDGRWHYYVFDLTTKEHWRGKINGWRFDIINGDCEVGNYVDFASVQFFSTLDAANAAAGASVTKNDSPHALGAPAVVRDDSEIIVADQKPVTFQKGDWFEETVILETEPVTPPEETQPSDPVMTQPSEETDTEAETASQPSTEGCASVAGVSLLVFLVPLASMIKKKNRRIKK